MYYCTDQTSSNRYGFLPLFRNLSLHAFRPTGAWKRWPIIWGISPKAGCRIQLPHKHLRKLLLIVLLTVATQPRQSVTSTSLGESRIWRLKSPLMMSKTGDIFGSGKPAHSSVDSLSGLERRPMIAGLSRVAPTIFPPITLLPLLTWKEMRSVLTWRKPIWSKRKWMEHLLLPFCMPAMGEGIIMQAIRAKRSDHGAEIARWHGQQLMFQYNSTFIPRDLQTP